MRLAKTHQVITVGMIRKQICVYFSGLYCLSNCQGQQYLRLMGNHVKKAAHQIAPTSFKIRSHSTAHSYIFLKREGEKNLITINGSLSQTAQSSQWWCYSSIAGRQAHNVNYFGKN